jgi:hypothetical protein
LEFRGWPGWDFAPKAKGTLLTVGGNVMRIEQQASESWCWSMGSTTQVTVEVDRHLPSNWMQFTGCERAPTTFTEHQLRDLLTSLELQSA